MASRPKLVVIPNMKAAVLQEYLTEMRACPRAMEFTKNKSLKQAARLLKEPDWARWFLRRITRMNMFGAKSTLPMPTTEENASFIVRKAYDVFLKSLKKTGEWDKARPNETAVYRKYIKIE